MEMSSSVLGSQEKHVSLTGATFYTADVLVLLQLVPVYVM